jgi:MFS family permease
VRAWLIWLTAVAVYGAAILHRTTLGVAAPQAADQFATSASVIALFVVLQVGMYSGMQIPAGVLLDRYGARLMLSIGASVMALGQLLLTFADTVPLAVVARMLTGTGDAAIFISALRLIPAWFSIRRIPVLTQMTGVIGQFGQILSAVPFAWALHRFGWTVAFGACAVFGGLIAVAAAVVVRDSPHGRIRRDTHVAERFFSQISAVVREPGTRMAMFEHPFACFAALSFGLMWGFPYLLEGEGVSPATASALFTVFVLGAVVAGPVIGTLTRRHPLRRSTLAMLASSIAIVPWVMVFLWPGPAPLWLLVVLVLGLSVSGPGSGVGLDHARTFNPPHRLGTATGTVVMAGFAVVLVAILFTGIALDAFRDGEPAALMDYRWAIMSVQVPLWLACWIGILVSRRQTRAKHGIEVPPWREVWRRRDR